ncbi:hypothetical protein Bbelb_104340 [Branchiostoma belcheri]|nr:hypothetical protein Bbelb_104340 [Branchiostoma belcheri]
MSFLTPAPGFARTPGVTHVQNKYWTFKHSSRDGPMYTGIPSSYVKPGSDGPIVPKSGTPPPHRVIPRIKMVPVHRRGANICKYRSGDVFYSLQRCLRSSVILTLPVMEGLIMRTAVPVASAALKDVSSCAHVLVEVGRW